MVAVILLISFRVTHRYWAKHTLFPVSVTQSGIIWALPKFTTYFPLKLFYSEITFQYKVLCTAILHVRFTTCGTIQSPPMKMINSFVLILHSVNAVKIYIAHLNHYKNYDQQGNGFHMEEDHVTNHLHLWWMPMLWQRYIWNDVVKHQNNNTMASEFQ